MYKIIFQKWIINCQKYKVFYPNRRYNYLIINKSDFYNKYFNKFIIFNIMDKKIGIEVRNPNLYPDPSRISNP